MNDISLDRIQELALQKSGAALYFDEECCEYLNDAQKLLYRERYYLLQDLELLIPAVNSYIVNKDTINGLVTFFNNEFYIFINKGVIKKQREFLDTLHYESIPDKKDFINSCVRYGFLFLFFHEYGHILTDMRRNRDNIQQQQNEMASDEIAVDFLIKRVIFENVDIKKQEQELVRLYIAVYYILKKMGRENTQEIYSSRRVSNYYDPEIIEQRSHPLDSQRIGYLFRLFKNIITVGENGKIILSQIHKVILDHLQMISGIDSNKIGWNMDSANEHRYEMWKQSIDDFQNSLHRTWNRFELNERTSDDIINSFKDVYGQKGWIIVDDHEFYYHISYGSGDWEDDCFVNTEEYDNKYEEIRKLIVYKVEGSSDSTYE